MTALFKKIMVIYLIFFVCALINAQTWQKIEMNFPVGDTLLSNTEIAFTTKNIGWIVTSGNIDNNSPPMYYATKILKTTDGGHNWVLQHSVSTFGGGFVFTVDSLHCWAYDCYAYGNEKQGFVFTSDGGAHWNKCTMPIPWVSRPYFFDIKNGIVLSKGRSWFTTDGGMSWKAGDSSGPLPLYPDIFFVDSNIGWIAGACPWATDSGAIANTTDGGRTWSYQDSITAILFGMDFVNSYVGFIVGTNLSFSTGYIYSTTNCGNDWTHKPVYRSGPMIDVGFLNSEIGWIIGVIGQIWKTTNGGETWNIQNSGVNATFVKIMVLREEKVAYIFGGKGSGSATCKNPFVLLYADLNNLTIVNNDKENIVKEFHLLQNYPNPFNASTLIHYQVPADNQVTLTVYDVLGREMAKLVDEVKHCGMHTAQWNASGFASGVYFYRLKAGAFSEAKKMLLIQ